MDPTLFLNMLAAAGITTLSSVTITPYLSALGPQDAFTVVYALFQASTGATNPVAFGKVVQDGAKCPAKLKAWQAASQLSTAVTESLQNQTALCDWQEAQPTPPPAAPGYSPAPGAGGGVLTADQVNAVLASLPVGVATSLGALDHTIPIVTQIVQGVCGANATSVCPKAGPVLSAGAAVPDLLEWAYQNGTLLQDAQAAAGGTQSLPDVIKADQQASGVAPGSGPTPALAKSSTSMVIPVLLAGGAAAALIFFATHKRATVKRHYVRVA